MHPQQAESLQITGSFQLFCVQPCSRHGEIAKKMNFAVSKQRYKNICLNIFRLKVYVNLLTC